MKTIDSPPKTESRLREDLAALGVAEGMTLLVHSSLSAIGWVLGGPQAVVRALLQVLGESGTLGWDYHWGRAHSASEGAMETPSSESPTGRTPRIVKFAVWLTFFNTWVLFEETVVDRYGLWQYMPYYRVAKLCSWDIGAMALLGYLVWWAFRGRKAGKVVGHTDGS